MTAILHINVKSVPEVKFEYHPGSEKVYMLAPKVEGKLEQVSVDTNSGVVMEATPIAIDVKSQNEAANIVRAWSAGFHYGTKTRNTLIIPKQ